MLKHSPKPTVDVHHTLRPRLSRHIRVSLYLLSRIYISDVGDDFLRDFEGIVSIGERSIANNRNSISFRRIRIALPDDTSDLMMI
jgi:hypothetical protein